MIKAATFFWQNSPTYWVFNLCNHMKLSQLKWAEAWSSVISAAENNGKNKEFLRWWLLQHQRRVKEPFTRVQFVCRAASSIWEGNRTSVSQPCVSALISGGDQDDDILESQRANLDVCTLKRLIQEWLNMRKCHNALTPVNLEVSVNEEHAGWGQSAAGTRVSGGRDCSPAPLVMCNCILGLLWPLTSFMG